MSNLRPPEEGDTSVMAAPAGGAGNKAEPVRVWRTRSRAQLVFGLAVLLPVLALYASLRFVPMLQTFRFSLYDWSLAAPTGHFIGLENFSNLLAD